MFKKTVLVLLAGTFLACGSSKGTNTRAKKGGGEKNVKVMALEPKEIVRINKASGTIEPLNEVKEVTKTGGTVSKINFKNGDKVRKGDVVIALEDQDVHSAYLKAEANYLSNKSDYETRRKNFQKFEQLYKEKLISEDEYLTKKNTFVQGQSALKTSEAAYLSAKKDYEDLTMKAKIDGIVTDLDVKLYQKIEGKSDVFTIVDDSKMRVKTGVSVHEIAQLAVGNAAAVEVEGLTDAFTGKVHEINPVASKDNKKYQIKVELENPEGKIKKGMYSKILVETGKKKGYLVPRNAIVIKELYSYIFVVEDGEAKRIRIERGYSNGDEQEILGEELQPSMTLVIDGQFLLEDKDRVRILN